MSEVDGGDPTFTLRPWPQGRGLTVQLHTKYLNYDVTDLLKGALRDALQAELDRGGRHLVLDLARVSIVDSCGVGLMIGLHQLAKAGGGALWLVGITHFLQKILRMMHLDQFFQVATNEAEVQRQLGCPVS